MMISMSRDFEGCGQKYSKCSSYVSHIYRRHRSFIMSDVSESVSMSDAGPSGVNEPCEVEQNDSDRSAGDVVHVDPHVMDQLLGLDAEQQQRMSALFLVGLKGGHCLSQAAIDDIVSSCQDMFRHYNIRIRAGVQEQLLNLGIEIPELDSYLSSTSDPFTGLHSTYMQEKFYREKLSCIVSIYC